MMKKVITDRYLAVYVQYLEKLHDFTLIYQFLHERMKIEKVKKLVGNLHDKIQYVIPIRHLKQALSYRLVLKEVHRTIKFNQKARLKPYIAKNNDLRKTAKNDFEKTFWS